MKFTETELEIIGNFDHSKFDEMLNCLIKFEHTAKYQTPDFGGAKFLVRFSMEASRQEINDFIVENNFVKIKSDKLENAISFIIIKRKIINTIKESLIFKLMENEKDKNIASLEKEIRELMEYKIHYDLAFKLKNGRSEEDR